jgi:hypothetical protein
MEYIFFIVLRSSKIIEAQKSFLRECRAKNCRSYQKVIPKGAQRKFCRSYQKVVPKGAQCKFCRSYKKVVPKGAQCKFSAQKSFQKECRAKCCRNIRRISSKDVPKGMQNLYRRNRRRRSSKDVPKGMQNLHRKINGEAKK